MKKFLLFSIITLCLIALSPIEASAKIAKYTLVGGSSNNVGSVTTTGQTVDGFKASGTWKLGSTENVQKGYGGLQLGKNSNPYTSTLSLEDSNIPNNATIKSVTVNANGVAQKKTYTWQVKVNDVTASGTATFTCTTSPTSNSNLNAQDVKISDINLIGNKVVLDFSKNSSSNHGLYIWSISIEFEESGSVNPEPVVAAPVITVKYGYRVEMSCEDKDAKILYSTKANAAIGDITTAYEGAFELEGNCTVSAIAVKGDAKSDIASEKVENYPYQSLAELKGKTFTNGQEVNVKGDMSVFFKYDKVGSGTYAFLTDGTANTLITGNYSDLKENDKIYSFSAYYVPADKRFTLISADFIEGGDGAEAYACDYTSQLTLPQNYYDVVNISEAKFSSATEIKVDDYVYPFTNIFTIEGVPTEYGDQTYTIKAIVGASDNGALQLWPIKVDVNNENRTPSQLSFGSDVMTEYMKVGETMDMPELQNPLEIEYEFSVSDPTIAVIEDGKIKALSVGLTEVIASPKDTETYYGTASFCLTVREKPQAPSITVTANGVACEDGGHYGLTVGEAVEIEATKATTIEIVNTADESEIKSANGTNLKWEPEVGEYNVEIRATNTVGTTTFKLQLKVEEKEEVEIIGDENMTTTTFKMSGSGYAKYQYESPRTKVEYTAKANVSNSGIGFNYKTSESEGAYRSGIAITSNPNSCAIDRIVIKTASATDKDKLKVYVSENTAATYDKGVLLSGGKIVEGVFSTDNTTITYTLAGTDNYLYFLINSASGSIQITNLSIYYRTTGDKEPIEVFEWSTPKKELIKGDDFVPPTFNCSVENLSVKFASSNPEVATVTSDGVVSLAEGIGEAIITASFAGNKTYQSAVAECIIWVHEEGAKLAPEHTGLWQQVVDSKDIVDGDVYIIVGKDKTQTNTYVMATSSNKWVNLNATSVVPDDEGIISTDSSMSVAEVVINKVGDNYTMYLTNGDNWHLGYITCNSKTAKSNNENEITLSSNAESQASQASIEFQDNGTALIKFLASAKDNETTTETERLGFVFNTTSKLFGCYQTNTDNILAYIYRVHMPEPKHEIDGGYHVISAPEGHVIWYRVNTPKVGKEGMRYAGEAVGYVNSGTNEVRIPTAIGQTVDYYSEYNGRTSAVSKVAHDGTVTGIDEVSADATTEVEWYDLSGRRVSEGGKGVFIRKSGSSVSKVVL